MTARREAIVLPVLFLTVALIGGLRIGVVGGVRLVPPSLFSVVLGLLLSGALVRARTFDPARLLASARTPLENASGAVVLVTLVAAAAQTFNAVTPERGLLNLLFNVFFLIEVLTTLAGVRGRAPMMRALMVLLGSAFALRFLLLEPFFAPAGGLLKRIVTAALEGLTLGTLDYDPTAAGTGYVALAAVCLFLAGVALLPAPVDRRLVRPAGYRAALPPTR